MSTLMSFILIIKLGVQDSMQVDTTAIGYKVGTYIGAVLPFIALLIIFLLIIRSRYRFKK